MNQVRKSAESILYEYGINIGELNEEFNNQLLTAMERYAEQFAPAPAQGVDESKFYGNLDIGDGKTWEQMTELQKANYQIMKLQNTIALQKNTIKRLREQSALTCCARWVKASEVEIKCRTSYIARWGKKGDADTISSIGWFQPVDETFFWHEQGYVPVPKEGQSELYLLIESSCVCQQELEDLRSWKKVVESNYPQLQAIQDELGVKKGTDILPAIKALKSERLAFPTREQAEQFAAQLEDDCGFSYKHKEVIGACAITMYDWIIE